MYTNKKKTKKGKGLDLILGTKNMRCSKCGKPVVLRTAEGIYKDNTDKQLYVCSGYPECDTYARVHPGTVIPMGTLADGKLRALRLEAHRHFDKLHKFGLMAKGDAYAWLADILQSPMSKAHIGHLTEYYCQVVIEESDKLFDRLRINSQNRLRSPSLQRGELHVV